MQGFWQPMFGSFVFPTVVMPLIIIWSLAWKGLALWKAAQRKEQWWFIALLVINTVGILEILYLYVFSKDKTPAHHQAEHAK